MLSKQEAFLCSARSSFAQANQRSVLSWNSLLSAYARHGQHGSFVFHLFQQMQQQGILPNRVSFSLTLSSLVTHPSVLTYGKRVHACVEACSFRSHVVVSTSLFNMYGRCGSLEAAWNVFIDMPTKDVVSWNAMLSLHAEHGLWQDAFHLLVALLNDGSVVPNNVTYVNVLGVCIHHADVQSGRLVHSLIVESMCEVDVVATTSLVSMYGKCGCFEDTWLVFLTMPERNVITWNALIFHFIQKNQSETALKLYHQMQSEGILQDNTTLVSIFGGCFSEESLAEGEWLLACILGSGSKLDVVVGNAVLNMYRKCGKIEKICLALDVMEETNVITWTTIITAYAQSNQYDLAFDYYQEMLQAGVKPNHVTFISVLDACAIVGELKQGKQVHAQIIDNGCDGERAIQNSLICLYGKCSSLRDAQDIFSKVLEPDILLWNAIIAASICQEDVKKAFELFARMLNGPISPNIFSCVSMFDVCTGQFAVLEGMQIHAMAIDCGFEEEAIIGTALINMYSKFSMLQDAQKAFNMVLEHNVISWTALITAYAREKRGKEALELFKMMQEKGIKPNNITFTSILASFSSTETALEAEQMCECILESNLHSDVVVGNSIITLYGKHGNVHCARMAFDKMVGRDIISWNAMVAVYAQHCSLQEVCLFIDRMLWEGFTPDCVTFLSIIHACCRQLAIFEGKRFHCYTLELGLLKNSMLATTLMTLYGKCGRVNDALIIFNNMPEHDLISWTVIISACAHNGQAKEAMQLFKQMQQDGVAPNEVTFSNVINACSHSGLFCDGLECFSSMVKTYNLSPDVNHYVSIIDLLGRAGQIHQADDLICDMPFQPSSVPYLSLLGACRQPLDVFQGEQAAGQAIELDSSITAPYIVLSNLHATACA